MRPHDLPTLDHFAARPHGTRLRYKSGCRCMECRAANSRYECERAVARKNGDWNGLVPADRARRHILKLSAAGIGRRAVAAASDVSETIIQKVRQGRKRNIRALTERRILAVDTSAVSDRALVNARRAWRLIEWLMSEGLSKAEISRRLGYARIFQFRRDRMTARNVSKVERLVAQMRVGEGRPGRRKGVAA